MNNLKEQLSIYNNFQECIIEDIKFSNCLTCIEIFFNYVWDKNNKIRANLDQKKWVVLKIIAMQDFKMENFTSLTNPGLENLNWSHCEISTIKAKSNNELEILWETDKKIVIKFQNNLEIMNID